jgi:hypothetical protein
MKLAVVKALSFSLFRLPNREFMRFCRATTSRKGSQRVIAMMIFLQD